MEPIPGKISNKEFQNLLDENQGFVSKKIIDGLKAAGLENLLHQNEVSRQEVMRALKTLQTQGSMTKLKRPGQLYLEAGVRQRDFDEAQHNATIKKFARLAIKGELEDEASELAKDLGKSRLSRTNQSVYSQLSEEQQARKKKVDDQVKKKEKYDNRTNVKPDRPKLLDLPDMDIG